MAGSFGVAVEDEEEEEEDEALRIARWIVSSSILFFNVDPLQNCIWMNKHRS
jgi:hypothetical protein